MTATRHAATATTVWCASYPKSSNTWLRALLTAYSSGGRVDINQLDGGDQPGAHAMLFDLLGLGVSGLAAQDVEPLRRLTTAAFGTLMSLEPAIAVVVGFVLLRQAPGWTALAGVGLVVAAGIGAERSGAR